MSSRDVHDYSTDGHRETNHVPAWSLTHEADHGRGSDASVK
jgi:hypothetical protein